MTHGTIAGILLTDLILGRENPWTTLYDPSRKSLAPWAGLSKRILNVAKQYGDWLTGGDVDSPAQIKPGEGAVIRHGLTKMAVYRDEQGVCHERSAVCTHLGGIVHWNDAERPWTAPVTAPASTVSAECSTDLRTVTWAVWNVAEKSEDCDSTRVKEHFYVNNYSHPRKFYTGMGATPHESGVAFRVWAPHADAVYVVGSFNDWANDTHPMEQEGEGYWYADISSAAIGDEYRYRIVNGDKELLRLDPYARQVTSSVGNAVVYDPNFDWEGDDFHIPPVNELVIYEMHLGTFHDKEDGKSDKFEEALQKLDHLQRLGVNVLEVMPLAQFAGELSWGYNPACVFAVETNYGGPSGFKRFVKAAHRAGLAVILDVVYNHFGPGDLDLWQFDGWSENGMGGIYFYNDWHAETPWGLTRPDYGRKEVRQFIRDNALMWLEEYHVDGLRFDMTLYIHNVRASDDPGGDLPDGWSLVQWINRDVRQRYPGRITIAEDLQNNDRITKPVDQAGGGFTAQWDARFVHPGAGGRHRAERRATVAGEHSRIARVELQRRPVPARDLQRVARRSGQRTSPRSFGNRHQEFRQLVRTKTLDLGGGPGVHGAGHTDAVSGTRVSGRRLVPGFGSAGLAQVGGVQRSGADVSRLDSSSPQPIGLFSRSLGIRNEHLPSESGRQRDCVSSLAPTRPRR